MSVLDRDAAFIEYQESYNKINLEKYSDYKTVDWICDLKADRDRHVCLKEKACNIKTWTRYLFDNLSGWVCVLLTGIASGLISGVVKLGISWLSNIREGICLKAFWLDREHCCWSSRNISFDRLNIEHCPQWKNWPQIFGIRIENFSTHFLSFVIYVLISMSFAGLACTFVSSLTPYASSSGIPEIKSILGGFQFHEFLSPLVLIVKSVGLILSTASGLLIGHEGPFVHIACCIGEKFSKFFPKYKFNESRRREILSASAATGISVAFGAPLGGVLFSLEEVSYYFPFKTLWQSFFCALIGAMMLSALNPFENGRHVQFSMNYVASWSSLEIIPFIFLGIFGGIWGSIFIKANRLWYQFRKSSILNNFPRAEVLILTFITASISYLNPYTRMSLTELIERLFSQCKMEDVTDLCDTERSILYISNSTTFGSGVGVRRSVLYLLWALVFQIVLFIFTTGIDVPAGIMIPSLCIGAIVGRITGMAVEEIIIRRHTLNALVLTSSDNIYITPGLYAIIGACAFLGGVTKMTISLVVIMFELTGCLSYVVPLMTACMTAKWVGDLFQKGGIYDALIDAYGYPYLNNKEDYYFTALAKDVLNSSCLTGQTLVYLKCHYENIEEVIGVLRTRSISILPVVESDENRLIIGQVSREDLEKEIQNQYARICSSDIDLAVSFIPLNSIEESQYTLDLSVVMNKAPVTASENSDIVFIISLFQKLGMHHIYLTRKGQLVGVLTKKDILNYLSSSKRS